jgi:hypothetical protein
MDRRLLVGGAIVLAVIGIVAWPKKKESPSTRRWPKTSTGAGWASGT